MNFNKFITFILIQVFLETNSLHNKYCKFELILEIQHCKLIFIHYRIEFIWIDIENPPHDAIGWVEKK